MTAAVVADASPLIAFQQIGQLQLLHSLFTEIVVPYPADWFVSLEVPKAVQESLLKAS